MYPGGVEFPIAALRLYERWCVVDILTPNTKYAVKISLITRKRTGPVSHIVEFTTLPGKNTYKTHWKKEKLLIFVCT